MRGQELLDMMGGIDECYIEAAAKSPRRKTPVWLRIVAAAACVCLLVGGVWQGLRWYEFRSTMLDGGAVTLPREGFSTSDTYATLSDLLTDLSDGEEHNTLRGDGGVDVSTQPAASAVLTEGQHAVVYNHYSYHLGGKKVLISDLSTETPTAVGAIDCDTTVVPLEEGKSAYGSFKYLFLRGDRLIAVSNLTVEKNTLVDRTYYTVVTVYDLSAPASPTPLHTWVQLGSLAHAYMTGEDLVLMTADGVCACGWSRLKDTDDYVPQLTSDGETVAWTDEELHILGSPSLVQYLAVTQINTANATVKDKHAFYGWVTNVYYGADWFLLDVAEEETELYTFSVGDNMTYTGSFGMPDEAFADTSVFSVTKDGDIFRVLGEYRTGRGGNMKTQLLGMTVNMKRGTSYYTTLGFEDEKRLTFTDVCWEEDRAVITADLSIVKDESRFLFAQFRGMTILLYAELLEADNIWGDGGYPIWKKTLIPMGKGIYLRYAEPYDDSSLSGLDLFDLSQSNRPVRLYDSTGELTDAQFAFCWTVYDQNTFGILVETDEQNGEYRTGTHAWHVYRVDPQQENPYTLLAAYEWEAAGTFDATSSLFAAFAYAGQHYITTRYMTVPLAVTW